MPINHKPNSSDELVNIAISRQRLAIMLGRHNLSLSEIRCLDQHSKHSLWQLCLEVWADNNGGETELAN